MDIGSLGVIVHAGDDARVETFAGPDGALVTTLRFGWVDDSGEFREEISMSGAQRDVDAFRVRLGLRCVAAYETFLADEPRSVTGVSNADQADLRIVSETA